MGVIGVGPNGLVVAVHGWTGLPVKKALTASEEQSLRSLPSTECPVNGTTSSWASGISAATRRASEVGVLRSCSPDRISVGTFGNALAAGGAAEASGQPAQSGTRLLAYAVTASNG